MTDKEWLIELIKNAEKAFSETGKPVLDIEEYVADYLLENGVVVLPVPVGSPCKILKAITGRKKIKKVEFEDAVVDKVCLLTKNESGIQIMATENVFPIKGSDSNG